jgi:hypothetical protein
LRSVLYQQENGFIVQKPLALPGSHPRTSRRLSLAPHVYHVDKKHALLAEECIMRLGNVLKILAYRPRCRWQTMKAGDAATVAMHWWSIIKAAYI